MIAKALIAVAALSLAGTGVADAASKYKRVRVVRHYPQAVVRVPAPVDPYARFYNNGPKPPWGAPQQCFTEEGYGRFWPCGAGPSSIN